MSTASTRDRLLRLLEPVVTAAGLDLEDLAVTPAGKRRLVRVVVDRDGGVSLDDVAGLSQAVSAALDSAEVMASGPYVLEVTSPGVDRPLAVPRHWRRAAGRLVSAQLAGGGEVTGRVRDADEDGVSLDVDGAARRLGYPEIVRAAVKVEFSRPGVSDEADALDLADAGDDAGDDVEAGAADAEDEADAMGDSAAESANPTGKTEEA